MSGPGREVPGEEVLYRRLPRGIDREFVDGPGHPPPPLGFFQFNESDETGMSLLRASERHPRWAAVRPDGTMCRLLPFQARDLYAIGCGLVVEPDGFDEEHETAAHCVIPDFRRELAGKKARKAKLPSFQRATTLRLKLCRERFVVDALPMDPPPDPGVTPVRPEEAGVLRLRARIESSRLVP